MKYFLHAFLISICIMSIFVSSVAHAQFSQFATEINLELSPENPGANQQVSAVASSYATNLDAATLTWKVNGKTIQSGKGMKKFSFITGATNTTTTLNLIVNTAEGETIEKSYAIKPVNVDLIWQASGYTPPFYKGKTLFSHQDRIQFIAIPHIIAANGQEISPKNLIYKWTRNGTIAGDFSGYGRDTYTVVSSIISRPLDVSVEVTSPGGEAVGFAEVIANQIEPSVLLYERSPLYGIQFQKALVGQLDLTDSKEIQVVAAPYFFGIPNLANGDVSYTWSINGAQIDSDTTATTRVFRQKEGVTGVSYISLSVENASKILQFASGGFSLKFDKPKADQTSF
jgi:hypothetical protein